MPALAGAIAYLYKNNESSADVILNIAFLLTFTFLAYSPVDFWQFLPKSAWATQFPYRLLSFVAIFAAIILGYACDAIGVCDRWTKMILMALVVIFFTGPALIAPDFIRAEGLSKNVNISSSFASQDYIVTDKSKTISGDGWLLRDNLLSLPATQSEKYIYLEARSGMPYDAGVDLQVINAKTKENILDQKLYIPASGIKTQIKLPRDVSSVSLVPDTFFKPSDVDPASTDSRELSLFVSALYLGENGTSLILPSKIDRKIISPYSRSFSFSRENHLTQVRYIAELPLAYSRFQEISQGGNVVRSESSFVGLTRVFITDLKVPVISCYNIPAAVRFLSVGGFLVLIFYLWLRQRNFWRICE